MTVVRSFLSDSLPRPPGGARHCRNAEMEQFGDRPKGLLLVIGRLAATFEE
jgi:hypothetical protein